MKKQLEDIFVGSLELTASERALLLHALTEWYMRGGAGFTPHNRRGLHRSVSKKIGDLKLHQMVSPDGSRLVSVEEHARIVAGMYPKCSGCLGDGEREIYPGVTAECSTCGGIGYTI